VPFLLLYTIAHQFLEANRELNKKKSDSAFAFCLASCDIDFRSCQIGEKMMLWSMHESSVAFIA
jgi:hypothetical protein